MKTRFFSIAAVTLSLLISGCASIGEGYSDEVVYSCGSERGSQRFIKDGNLIGCGSVVSLRDVNQNPTYDQQYEMQVMGGGSSNEVTGLLAQTGIIGAATAVIATTVIDTTVDATRSAKKQFKMVNVPKNHRMVKAVQLRLDDGREVNLPLLNANKFDASGHYKVGNRYRIFYSPTYDNLQLLTYLEKDKYDTPEEAAKARKWLCGTQLDKAKVDQLIADNAHKVDESKIY